MLRPLAIVVDLTLTLTTAKAIYRFSGYHTKEGDTSPTSNLRGSHMANFLNIRVHIYLATSIYNFQNGLLTLGLRDLIFINYLIIHQI